jgi:hypothetical protein
MGENDVGRPRCDLVECSCKTFEGKCDKISGEKKSLRKVCASLGGDRGTFGSTRVLSSSRVRTPNNQREGTESHQGTKRKRQNLGLKMMFTPVPNVKRQMSLFGCFPHMRRRGRLQASDDIQGHVHDRREAAASRRAFQPRISPWGRQAKWRLYPQIYPGTVRDPGSTFLHESKSHAKIRSRLPASQNVPPRTLAVP